MNPNFATPQDRAENYAAAHELMKFGKRSKVKSAIPFSASWQRAKRLFGNRTPNPIVPNMADYVMWDLYDRLVFAAGASIPTNNKLFTVPIGTSNKTKADTNLDLVSQLPNPYWMNVTHLAFYVNPTVLDIDINALFDQSYFEFWVNNKIYIEGKLNMFPSGGGITGYSTRTSQSEWTNGTPMVSNMFDLRIPGGTGLGTNLTADGLTGIAILQQQNFRVEVNLPAGALALTANNATPNVGTGLTLGCYLFGVLSRSVQ